MKDPNKPPIPWPKAWSPSSAHQQLIDDEAIHQAQGDTRGTPTHPQHKPKSKMKTTIALIIVNSFFAGICLLAGTVLAISCERINESVTIDLIIFATLAYTLAVNTLYQVHKLRHDYRA